MTTPVVVFPDAAAVVCSHLDTELGVTVGTRVPDERPDEFVLVRRVGGPRRDIVTDQATLTIEAWSATEEEAHDLAQLARGHVHALSGRKIDDVTVYRVEEFAGPASLPDPLSEQPRYTLTVAVACRGAAPAGS